MIALRLSADVHNCFGLQIGQKEQDIDTKFPQKAQEEEKTRKDETQSSIWPIIDPEFLQEDVILGSSGNFSRLSLKEVTFPSMK